MKNLFIAFFGLLTISQNLKAATCDTWSAQQFSSWRSEAIANTDYEDVMDITSSCAPRIEELNLNMCLDNLRNFSRMQTLGSGHKLKFLKPDAEFLEQNAAPIQMPQELMIALPLREIPEDFDQKIAEDKIDDIKPANLKPFAQKIKSSGWKYLTYASQSFGNPSQDSIRSFRRLLVFVPGLSGEMDLFIQLTMPKGNEKQYLVDAIGVQKPSDAVAERGMGARPRIAFKQFWRVYPSNSSGAIKAVPRHLFDMSNLEEVAPGSTGHNYNLDTCLTCHSTGLRKIYPAELNASSPVSERFILNDLTRPGFLNRLKEMNNKIAEYGKADFKVSEIADLGHFGPGMGGMSQKTKDFLKGCFENSGIAPMERVDVLVKASNCAACHGTIASPITRNFERSKSGGLALKLLVDKSMPPGKLNAETGNFDPRADLSDSERNALYNCLIKEQDQSVQNWFTEKSCQ